MRATQNYTPMAVMTEQVQFFQVTEDQAEQRLDNFLGTRLRGVPKSALYRIIRQGQVRVNKGRAKPDRKLKAGDMVRVPPIRTADPREVHKPGVSLVERLRDGILFDEGGLLIVNKPSGLAVHGGSGVNLGLIEALRQLPEYSGFLELVHRLDKETSGCIMIARKRSTLRWLQSLLRERKGIIKTYTALVQGEWPATCTEIAAPLQRYELPDGSRMVKVHQAGKEAFTRFRVIERFERATLIEAQPQTGRTHQIRVHAGYAGCPLVGDLKYGETARNSELMSTYNFRRLCLHASRLRVTLQDGSVVDVSARLPPDFSKPLERMSSESGRACAADL